MASRSSSRIEVVPEYRGVPDLCVRPPDPGARPDRRGPPAELAPRGAPQSVHTHAFERFALPKSCARWDNVTNGFETPYQLGRLVAASRTVLPDPPWVTSYQAESVFAFAPRAMTLTTE